LRQQSTPLPTSPNGLAGLQRLNPEKYVKPQAVLYSSNKNYLRKDRLRTLSANSTKLHVNSNSFPQITKTPASSTIYKTSPLQHPLTTPYGKLGTWARTNIAKAHAFANHLVYVFQQHPTNLPDEEEPLVRLLESPYQLELPSTNSNKPKFKQSSTTFIPKLPLATTSSCVKSSKNYLLLATNTSSNFSMLPSSSDTSPTNGNQIILLLKPGKLPNVPTSYRPISLLPTHSRVFEKLFHHRLLPWL
jgi:hypothetical protein